MKRYLLLTSALALLAGCSFRDKEAAARLEEQQRQIATLQQSVGDLAQAAQKPRTPTEAELARDKKLEQAEDRLADVAARLGRLEQSLAKPAAPEPVDAAAKPAAAPAAPSRAVVRYQNKPPQVSVYSSADTRAADFIETPTGQNPDLFPVVVRAVVGKRAVTGTHPTTRIVTTDEVYKDEFGRERKRTKEVAGEENEYGYEVSFALENLTRTEKVVSCSAGAATRMLTLLPGEKRLDVVVRSELGASLRVEVGSDFKRFGITY